MHRTKKNLTEIFLESLGTDYSTNNIIKALEWTDKELKRRMGEYTEYRNYETYFFKYDDLGVNMHQENFEEMLNLLDVFQEFDNLNLKLQMKKKGKDIFIVKVLHEILMLNQINQIKQGYLRSSTKKEFDQFLDLLFNQKGEKKVFIIGMSNGRIVLQNTYDLHNKFQYTSKKQAKSRANLETITTINILFKLFNSLGIIIFTTKNKNKLKCSSFLLYNQTYHKIPKLLANKIIQNTVLNKYLTKYQDVYIH